MPGASELAAADRALLQAARDARENAYAPISRYKVGAAVRAEDGSVGTGANVENIVLPEGACAEKVALYAAVARGHRTFDAVAVFTESSPPAVPCGSCRQILSHWGVQRAICGNLAGEVLVVEMTDLLPWAFELRDPPE